MTFPVNLSKNAHMLDVRISGGNPQEIQIQAVLLHCDIITFGKVSCFVV